MHQKLNVRFAQGGIFMGNPFKSRGFKAFREEEEKRKKQAEQRRGKLFRFLLKDGEKDVPILFLTNEPVLFQEHQWLDKGKVYNVTCTGDNDCEECVRGHRPSYRGAFLIVDRREYEQDERDAKGNKTGKKIKVKDRLRLLIRGATDMAKLDRIEERYGLMSRQYFVTKVGSGNTTSYEFDRSDREDKLTSKQIATFLSQLPEKYRGMNPYEVIEANIFDDGADVEDYSAEESEEVAEEVNRGVWRIDREESTRTKPTGFRAVQKPKPAVKAGLKPVAKPSTPSAKPRPRLVPKR
jgi:hypothetical protein